MVLAKCDILADLRFRRNSEFSVDAKIKCEVSTRKFIVAYASIAL